MGHVRIKCWHVKIIDEVDELEFANWSVRTTGLLLELSLENILQQNRVSVEVEVANLHDVLISCCGQLIQKTHRDLGLTTTGITDKHG